MRDIQQYWRDVRAIEKGLPDFVWVVASGHVSQAAREIAARLIRRGSHRQATEEEVAAHLEAETREKKRARREEKAKQGAAVVPVITG